MQNSANLRSGALQIGFVRVPSEKHAAQHGGKLRKHSLGNYESPALPLSYRPTFFYVTPHFSKFLRFFHLLFSVRLRECDKLKHNPVLA
jgi:hypothetical protein